jgi:hypothetical protein
LQTINWSKASQFHIKPLIMPLNYLRDDCHKQAVTHIRESRRFKLMYTLQGKTRPTRHVRFPRQSTYARRTLPADGSRTWQPFARHRQIWTDHTAPEKKGSQHNTQHADWPIHGSIPSFSPEPANEAGGVSQAPEGDQLLDLLSPYHRHAIDTFNTYSWEPTHQSLTDTGGGYNISGAGSPHTHSPTFLTSCLSFPLAARPVSILTKFYQLPQSVEFTDPMAATWSFDHSAIYRSLHLRLVITNDLSLVIGSQGYIKKYRNATGVSIQLL